MAKTKGVIALTGTVGGLNFYLRKGVPVTRTAGGGFNGKKIRTSPTMVRVRENGSEFKGCVQNVKHFKAGLQPWLSSIKDGELHQRLVSLFTKIKNADALSTRGQRNVAHGLLTDAGRALLRGYIFDSGAGLTQVLQQPFSWDTDSFIIADFDAGAVNFPVGGTQLNLTALCYRFDFKMNVGVVAASETKVIFPNSISGTISLITPPLADGEGISIRLVHYQVLQELNGVLYDLKGVGGVGMEVVAVAVGSRSEQSQ